MEITYYAVRDKTTNEYIPQMAAEVRSSVVKPVPITGEDSKLKPRLFTTARAAKIFLKHWLKGECWATPSHDYDGEYIKEYEKDPARIAANMEVVSLKVTL